ncbi:MAG: hypothetical protein ACI83I_000762 [Bacteroidia bacterium]
MLKQKNRVEKVLVVITMLVCLASCCSSVDREVSFPIFEEEQFFVQHILFGSYDSLVVYNELGQVSKRINHTLNVLRLDSATITDMYRFDEKTYESMTYLSTLSLDKFGNVAKIEEGAISSDHLFSRPQGFTTRKNDKYGNTLKIGYKDDFYSNFKYIKCGTNEYICRLDDNLGNLAIRRNFVYRNKQLISVKSETEGIGCSIDYDSIGRIVRVEKVKEKEKRVYDFKYESNLLKAVSLFYSGGSKQYTLEWTDSSVSILENDALKIQLYQPQFSKYWMDNWSDSA